LYRYRKSSGQRWPAFAYAWQCAQGSGALPDSLEAMGYSQQRWQEIVNDVNPELRFVLRSQMLDAIITYLKSAGKPVERNRLARALYAQAAGPMQRIRQSITSNLRIGNLTVHSGNKVGLPAWKKTAE
jgi:hypothetical protein